MSTPRIRELQRECEAARQRLRSLEALLAEEYRKLPRPPGSSYTSWGNPLKRGEAMRLVLQELRHGPGTCVDIANRLDLQPWGSHVAAQLLSLAYKRGKVTRSGSRGRGNTSEGYVYSLPEEK